MMLADESLVPADKLCIMIRVFETLYLFNASFSTVVLLLVLLLLLVLVVVLRRLGLEEICQDGGGKNGESK